MCVTSQIVLLVLIAIFNGIDNNFGGYDLTREFNVRLGSTDDFPCFVFIIIFFSTADVNRTDDISIAIVGAEKLRTSEEVRRKQ